MTAITLFCDYGYQWIAGETTVGDTGFARPYGTAQNGVSHKTCHYSVTEYGAFTWTQSPPRRPCVCWCCDFFYCLCVKCYFVFLDKKKNKQKKCVGARVNSNPLRKIFLFFLFNFFSLFHSINSVLSVAEWTQTYRKGKRFVLSSEICVDVFYVRVGTQHFAFGKTTYWDCIRTITANARHCFSSDV